jgi:hypothetical protein
MFARLTFIFLFFAGTIWAQSPADKCSIFREGKFRLISTVSGNNYIITRTKKVQTEQEEGDAEVASFKIKWVNNCTYELRPYKVSADFKKKWGKHQVLVCEITEVDGNKCTVYAKFKYGNAPTHITHLEKTE